MKKTCSRCKIPKYILEFPKDNSKKDGLYPACNVCRKEIKKISYQKHKKEITRKNRERRKDLQLWAESFKTKCERCPESHPGCLDFHHKDDNKEHGVAYFINKMHVEKEEILREISKCIVLCSNCHRKLHWNERQMALSSNG